ncbi:MAG: transketolase [Halanaerobiales bacterium]|nr:transketolase [Halanaerobiales bacterium]
MEKNKQKKFKILAEELRLMALQTVNYADSGHLGGSLSVIDILTDLYFNEMNIKTDNPRWEERDRLVLSKGHCTPALYSVLAKRGFFPVEELKNFRTISSFLSGHAEMNLVPGVDMSTGSLGQGLSAAVGMAIAGKIDQKDYTVYAILGDGEVQEGQVWEAAMAAANYQLDNLIVFIDNNNLQIDGELKEVMSPYPINDKFKAFGWEIRQIDGHNFEEIESAVLAAQGLQGKPVLILARTVKGKGVSFMENNAYWHGKVPDQEQFKKAVNEINQRIKLLGVE